MNGGGYMRMRALQAVVAIIFAVILCRIFYLQVVDERYKTLARSNVLRHEVQYPPRGEVYDRNGEFLVQSKEVYDLMVTSREMNPEGFDTVRLCRILGIGVEQMRSALADARMRPRVPHLVASQLPKEVKLRFDEGRFKGFYTVFRTIRSYPRKIGGNLLGYVGEINAELLRMNPDYRVGDYIGISGVESAYESVLRGTKGVKINEIDAHGAVKGSYRGGLYDSLPVPGRSIVCTIDARLQALAEELLRGKVGSVVAIEPSTGEILMMVSSPTYDPDELVGKDMGNHYMTLLRNKRRPLYNRAVSSRYPPGSTFKLVQGLIGLQEEVLQPSTRYACHNGYAVGNLRVKCHDHSSPVDLAEAVATSCNAYFCNVFRSILDNPRYGDVKGGYDVWADYVESFGFGRRLGSDFKGELAGYVPPKERYNKIYRNHWNSLTVISLSIGQGELGCTPLQMANLAATVANRGYYYIPHVVKRIEGRDSIDARFYERRYTKVEPRHFEPIVEGMYRSVNVAGTSRGAYVEGLDICGKTGTAQNPHGRDHSTFLCFAPREDPKIALSVYIENGGFGATVAVPVASLLIEQYLTDTIRRSWLVDYVKAQQILYPAYADTSR